MARLLKAIYRRLPLSPRRKTALKDLVYSRFGSFFAHTYGYRHWRMARDEARPRRLAPRPEAPDETAWADLESRRSSCGPDRRPAGEAGPIVVVPVYRGRSETLACLYSVLDADPGTHLVVIDDASDDAKLANDLASLAARGLVRLERNERNMGFVATANHGLMLYPDRDVVLLNSDTQVFGDWLTRLERHAGSAPDIGTVTPLTNNGEICSYPSPLRDNPEALELDDSELDTLAARVNRNRRVDAPTAVGFCMYIRRRCLDEVGLFDPAYGAGYGEENDFCLRARVRGWRSVVAGDVFVRHLGGVSFGAGAEALRDRALRRLRGSHPEYEGAIARFIEHDPIAPLRIALDLARLSRAAPNARPTRTVLHVTHVLGGGVERHIARLTRDLEREGANVFRLRPGVDEEGWTVGIERAGVEPIPNVQRYRLPAETPALLLALRTLGIDHVHVHGLVGYDEGITETLRTLCAELGCRLDVTAHDYQSICPRVNLMHRSGRYCDEPDPEGCRPCLRKDPPLSGRPDVELWRARWNELLADARRVFCPSRDVEQRLARYFPEAKLVLRPHPEERRAARRPSAPCPEPRPLRIAVIGAVGPHKGSRVLLEVCRDAARRRLPIEFRLVGFSDIDDRLEATGRVRVTGAYEDDALDEILEAQACHLALFLSVVPETYCYTLSSAFRAGLYPVAFDLGANAERIRALGWGRTIPLELRDAPGRLNDLLLELDVAALPPVPGGRWEPEHYESIVRDYYEDFAP